MVEVSGDIAGFSRALRLVAGLFAWPCSKDAPDSALDAVVFTQIGLYPEGVQLDAPAAKWLRSKKQEDSRAAKKGADTG